MNRNEWNRTTIGRIYNIIAWLTLVAVGVQVFLAGYAVTADPVAWLWHKRFVHVVEPLPLVLAAVAGFGKGPRRLLWIPLALVGLIWLQYALIQMPSGVARALHPTNALVIGILVWTAARTSLPGQKPDTGAPVSEQS